MKSKCKVGIFLIERSNDIETSIKYEIVLMQRGPIAGSHDRYKSSTTRLVACQV